MRAALRQGSFGSPLLAIILVSVALRVGSALLLGDTVTDLPGIFDQISYDTLARQVLADHGFRFATDWWPATRAGEPTAHWSFLYTLYLAGAYAVAGPHPLVPRLGQAVVAGVLFPWLAWRLGRRVFGAEVGVLSAALIAVYGYFIYYAGALMTETFFILAVLCALDLLTQLGSGRLDGASHSPTWPAVWVWVALGLALGAAVLLRQLILLCLPLLFAWLVWAHARRLPGGWGRRWLMALRRLAPGVVVATLVVAVLILPWTVRNSMAFGRFVLLNTNAGYAFFFANHPLQGTTFTPILPGSTYHDMIPPELLGLDEAGLDSALLARGLGFVRDDPGRYALLTLSRLQAYFEFWPSSSSRAESNLARVLSYGLYLPLMLAGLLLAAMRLPRLSRAQQAGILLLWLLAGVYTAIHLLSWALIRYRLPVDAILIPFAALAASEIAAGLGRVVGRRYAIRRAEPPLSGGG